MGDSMISIHALREEGDGLWVTLCPWCHQFLSTPSARRATRVGRPLGALRKISIHALREEGDWEQQTSQLRTLCISIHALREEGDAI